MLIVPICSPGWDIPSADCEPLDSRTEAGILGFVLVRHPVTGSGKGWTEISHDKRGAMFVLTPRVRTATGRGMAVQENNTQDLHAFARETCSDGGIAAAGLGLTGGESL